jgi:hypothetical protein
MKFEIELGSRRLGVSIPHTQYTVSIAEPVSAKTRECIGFTQQCFPSAYIATLPFRASSTLCKADGEVNPRNENVLHNSPILAAVLNELCNDLKTTSPIGMGALINNADALEAAIALTDNNLDRLKTIRSPCYTHVEIADTNEGTADSVTICAKIGKKMEDALQRLAEDSFLEHYGIETFFKPSINELQKQLLTLQKLEASLAIRFLVLTDKNIAAKVNSPPPIF